MAQSDSTTSSSYSDPIYDRLDILAQAVRHRWYIYVTALLLIIFVALLIRREINNRPDQVSAAAFSRAFDGKDEPESLGRFKALAEDAKADPYSRAPAWIEVTQYRLNADDANAAKIAAQNAVTQASATHDTEIKALSRLSLAAAEYQLGDFADALNDYSSLAGSLGAREAALDLEANLGKARTLQSQGKLSDAAATLEPLLTRQDAGAEKQLDVARVLYWSIKRAMQPLPAIAPLSASPSASSPLIMRPTSAPVVAPAVAAPAGK